MKARAIHGVRVVRAAGRKDRHSKVCTARGTRDRRVRLSPKTAILFYDVQDRLGYDRPSKAIDWLMKEAKAAIDALDPSPSSGVILDHSNEGAAPLLSEISISQDYQQQFLPAPAPLGLFDANSEMVRLQRIFYATAGGEEDYSSVISAPDTLLCPAASENMHMLAEREPLQSSYWRINDNSPEFQGFRFSDEELPGFCGGVAFHDEGEMGNFPVLSKSCSAASFVHHEE